MAGDDQGNPADRDQRSSWSDGFRCSFAAPDARQFVEWAAEASGSRVALQRARLDMQELRPWLGSLSILQWDRSDGDFRYRLFGTSWAEFLRRDFTGQCLSAWPDKMAGAIRGHLAKVVTEVLPAGSRIAAPQYFGAEVRRSFRLLEQVAWPLSYGPGTNKAVLMFATRVPLDSGLDAYRQQEDVGRVGHWFDAYGQPVEPLQNPDAALGGSFGL